MEWTPIITKQKLKAKAFDILNQTDSFLDSYLIECRNLEMYGGKTGISLFKYYYSILLGNSINKSENLFSSIEDELMDLDIDPYFILSLSGFSWLMLHLYEKGDLDIIPEEYFSDVDALPSQSMLDMLSKDKYELMYGSTNIANFFYNRYRLSNNNTIHIDKYLSLLYEQGEKVGNTISWKSLIKRTEYSQEEYAYNLGMAHGIPALLMYFSNLKKSGYASTILDELLSKTINYLFDCEQDKSVFNSYYSGARFKDNSVKEMSRLGWCYGDLIVGYSLYHASKYLEEPSLRTYNKGMQILLDSCNRKEYNQTLISDSCLCHGTAGVALIYDRMYKETSIEIFKDTALYWYEKTILSYNKKYPGGYNIYKGNNVYGADYSLLNGIAGIGLALISAISPIEPKWDNVLLLS
ncbi:MAG: lanthionine synthetase C family protein [Clostridiales bacterium]|nr:lanthionine synthetase C family protein [Clostridiales bacterium]